MTDELNINRITDFSASNLSFNADFNVSKPVVNSYIFENYFSNPVSLGNFDCFNNISYIPQFNFNELFSFKSFEFPKFKFNFSLPDFQSNFSLAPSFMQSWQTQSTGGNATSTPDAQPENKPIDNAAKNASATTKSGNSTVTGNSTRNYMHLSKAEAYKKAEKDPNLEKLTSGKNWSVCSNSFKTDIPFAKKGTSDILEKVAQMLGVKLVITSALGTGEPGNPHKKTGYDSHHNDENAKLDIRTIGNANDFAERLRKTGYFSHVLPEGDHIDVQIDISKFKTA